MPSSSSISRASIWSSHGGRSPRFLASGCRSRGMGIAQAAPDQHVRLPEPVLALGLARLAATDAVAPEVVMVLVDLHDHTLARANQDQCKLRPVVNLIVNQGEHHIHAALIPGNQFVLREAPEPTQFLRP